MATWVPAGGYPQQYTATVRTNGELWYQWVNDDPWYTGRYTTTTASNLTYTPTYTTTTAHEPIWRDWVRTYDRDVMRYETTINDRVWDYWVEGDTVHAEVVREGRRAVLDEDLHRDELQAMREQRSRERLAAQQRRQEDRIVAHARSLDLLDGLLSEEEKAERVKDQRITILGSDGEVYRLEMHRETVHGNIVRVDEHGCPLGRACVAPGMYDRDGNDALPTPDGWVGQYLGLKFDAATFLSHANWSQIGRCRNPDRVAA